MIVVKIANNFPKDCGECPLFKERMYSRSCAMGGDFTKEEIEIARIEDDNIVLDMYYHGYLDGKRPKNCPLIEMRGEENESKN